MVQDFVHDIAARMDVKLSKLSVVDGFKVGCLDAHLLHFTFNGHQQSALVYRSELDKIQIGECCDRLELRIRSTLSHLKIKQKP
jgi:hypothetical protein